MEHWFKATTIGLKDHHQLNMGILANTSNRFLNNLCICWKPIVNCVHFRLCRRTFPLDLCRLLDVCVCLLKWVLNLSNKKKPMKSLWVREAVNIDELISLESEPWLMCGNKGLSPNLKEVLCNKTKTEWGDRVPQLETKSKWYFIAKFYVIIVFLCHGFVVVASVEVQKCKSKRI